MKSEFAPGITSFRLEDEGIDEWYEVASLLLERREWALLEELTDYGYADWPECYTDQLVLPNDKLSDDDMSQIFGEYLETYEQDEPQLLWGAWELIDDSAAEYGVLWINPSDPRYPTNTFSADFSAASSWPYARVYWSTHVTQCNLCSPCYPGQGNLDEPTSPDTYGVWAYDLPPEEYYPDWSMYAISLPVREAHRRMRWTAYAQVAWIAPIFRATAIRIQFKMYRAYCVTYAYIVPKLACAKYNLRRNIRNAYYATRFKFARAVGLKTGLYGKILWLPTAASLLQRIARLVRR